jgi:hypothetical protein
MRGGKHLLCCVPLKELTSNECFIETKYVEVRNCVNLRTLLSRDISSANTEPVLSGTVYSVERHKTHADDLYSCSMFVDNYKKENSNQFG